MRRVAAALAAAVLVCAAEAAADPATVVFQRGDIGRTPDGEVRVRSGLLQLELAPGVVLSASAGAAFRMAGTDEITVLDGAVRVLHVPSDTVGELRPGRYRLELADRLAVLALPETLGAFALIRDHGPGVHLADGVMLRQDQALWIPTADLVRAIFGFFRGAGR
ncbi:MAG: hypothetical protein A3G81_08370 [Betaproteobacteria bacterium RIFCSPLOWO2_12_FULL_65_14]|nr:MAG: hypothetical protein A3G81_08370 [Betaproteobacteria bacterium RIFCSPLOWO2_12_FULL_65_14]